MIRRNPIDGFLAYLAAVGGVSDAAKLAAGSKRGSTSRGRGRPTMGVKKRQAQRRGKLRRRPGRSKRRRPLHKR